MPHPIAYLRKSKSDDPSKEVSRDVQEHAVRDLAARDGYNGELELFVDWDRSADEGKASRRTAYREMLRRIEAGDVSVVYAYAVDRLYRSLGTFLRLTEAATAQRVRIVTAREGVLGGDGSPMAQAFAQIGAVFTELELNTAKSRAKAAHAARVRRGDHIGQVPYGYRLVKGPDGVNRLETDPERSAAPIVDAYRRAGGRVRTAVRIVNDELHLPAPYGGTWDRPSLLRLIAREAPQLLPAKTATGRREAPVTPALLAKLLRCHCGRLLTPNRHVERRRKRESLSVSYYCARGHAARNDHPRVYVAESVLLPFVRAEADRLRPPPAVQADENSERQAAIAERKRRLALTFADGALDEPSYRAELAKLAAEQDQLEAASRIVPVPAIDWTGWSVETLNTVLRSLLRYVQLDEMLRPVRAEWLVPEWRA